MPKSVQGVDDSATVRKVMRQFFERLADWEVRGEAADGAEAIQKAMELKPELILSDVSMPRMNGIEAASVLKKITPDRHIIVFAMFDDALSSRVTSAVGEDLVVPMEEGLTVLAKALDGLMATAGLISDGPSQITKSPGLQGIPPSKYCDHFCYSDIGAKPRYLVLPGCGFWELVDCPARDCAPRFLPSHAITHGFAQDGGDFRRILADEIPDARIIQVRKLYSEKAVSQDSALISGGLI
jgi:CheY-like chemotaxis protein